MAKSVIELWMMHMILLRIACLLASSSYMIGWTARVVHQLEPKAVVLDSHFQQATHTLVHITSRVDRIADCVVGIECQLFDTLHKYELRALISESEQVGPDIFHGRGPGATTDFEPNPDSRMSRVYPDYLSC